MSKDTSRESNFKERYNKLNAKQKQAVDTTDGPVLVIAGPGSGKTELLSIRTANILKQTDILPGNILLLTFTDAGSYNMRDRLVKLIGETAYRVSVYTFHAFASDIINKHSEYFFDGSKFRPATEVDQVTIIENILKSLPRNNPLSSFHPELGFVYTRDIISAIRDLKKGNFPPDKFAKKLEQNFTELNQLHNLFKSLEDIQGKRKLDEVLPVYIEIYNTLLECSENTFAKTLLSTLELAIKNANDLGKSTPLTAWKNSYSQKTESGKFILKDAEEFRKEKLESLLGVYSIYQNELYRNALYDFEDMILLTIKAIHDNPNLKADLQERYQYIMLDEFQDTNDSQFQLVLELTKNGDSIQNPNILAVGDDDQAIFKFQGAELNNIFSFIQHFGGAKKIVLDTNYRSTQEVLDFARRVILKAQDRLEVRDKSITKNLIAKNPSITTGEIITKSFENEVLENKFVAEELKRILDKGVDPKEIAVIARKHDQLTKLTESLNAHKIPYSYTKRENILKKKHIHELINIIIFLYQRDINGSEDLLPEILSYDFWGLDRLAIWQIAEAVKRGIETEEFDIDSKKTWRRLTWLEAMNNSNDIKVKQISDFLIDLSVKSRSTPIEYLLDEIIGTTEFLWEDSEHDDTMSPIVSPTKDFVSPYKMYYFNNKIFEHNRPRYLEFLTTLRTFIGALREFKGDQVLYAKDIFDFVEVYNGNNLTLSATSPFASSEESISLLTAHASKGLEFEYVFVIGADMNTWGRSGHSSKIQFPLNMPLSPEGENDDDKIRLLYVALTRSKHTLYITHNSQKVGYLLSDTEQESVTTKDKNIARINLITNEVIGSMGIVNKGDFLSDEKILLKRLLENYKMPVTHLNNFLNFTKVGPMKFLEQNILRFPQAMTASSAYGSAMHDCIERYFLYFKKFGKRPDREYVMKSFENYLQRSRLPEQDYKKYLQSGYENLKIYLDDLEKKHILPETKVEIKFSNENVIVGECPITGNIDRIEFLGNGEVMVTDLKTGESYNSFEESGLQDYEKIKLHFYKYQLAFYALLIEHSKSFNQNKIKVAVLEFLEANKQGEIVRLPFEIDKTLKERVKNLANIIIKKVNNLDFPDTSHYPQNLKGILQFEEDLLEGRI